MQCCTCSNWVHLRCSQISLSKFRTLDSSHSSDSFDTYTSTVQSSPSSLLHSHPTLVFTHASGGVITFIRQSVSFSKLSTLSFSSLDPYSDYGRVNISLSNSISLSFFNVCVLLFTLLLRVEEPTPLLPPFFHPPEILYSGRLQLPSTPLGLKRYFRPPWRGSIRPGHLF